MKRRSAFTLIELSLVLIIGGLIIYGVVQGVGFFKVSRLAAARAMTSQSPVNDIEGLVAWYETSLPSSFPAGQVNNIEISTWYDNSYNLFSNKRNATQSTPSLRPKFIDAAFINGIPAARFDGIDDRLFFDGTILAGSPYTVFVVEQKRSSDSAYFIMGDGFSGTNINLVLGYRNDTTITQTQWSNDIDIAVTGYTSPTPRIHTFWLSDIYGKRYWLNGGINPDGSNSSQTQKLVSYSNAALGGNIVNFYNGDLGEVIIFNRALSNEERQSVEAYLGKKFNISII